MVDTRVAATIAPRTPSATTTGPADASTRPGQGAGRRIAYLSFSSGEYDARTFRMARSALDAGYKVTVYCRWREGLPTVEERDGYRVVRVPWDWQLAIPLLRRGAADRARAAMAATVASAQGARKRIDDDAPEGADEGADEGGKPADAAVSVRAGVRTRLLPLRVVRRLGRPVRRWWHLAKSFPLRPLGWAWALERVAEPADIWHGMWAGSLPALDRLRQRHGGRTIYDSRDVYMHSREFARAGWPIRDILVWFERRWARSADCVLTVNEAYADLLAEQLQVERPAVVMNCPERWTPPERRPDHLRRALGLPATTRIALYQGHLTSDRGIEQSMTAILNVPDAVLALLGFGAWQDRLAIETTERPYAGKVFLVPPVSPDELLGWTASADVAVMAIQPSSINHQYTTPQKLFESVAAGVPVVASDLPGMAEIVLATGVGLVVDPTSPTAIAAALRQLLDASDDRRRATRERVLAVAHARYNWEAQVEALLAVYAALLPAGAAVEGRRR